MRPRMSGSLIGGLRMFPVWATGGGAHTRTPRAGAMMRKGRLDATEPKQGRGGP